MATSAPALAQRRRATPASAVIIRGVFFSEQHEEVKVQLQWTEGDPRSFHVLRTPTVPVSAFAHSPDALLDSDAWAAFVTSDAFGHWRQHYPAAFDAAETTLGLQAAAQDPDTLMEWQVSLQPSGRRCVHPWHTAPAAGPNRLLLPAPCTHTCSGLRLLACSSSLHGLQPARPAAIPYRCHAHGAKAAEAALDRRQGFEKGLRHQ